MSFYARGPGNICRLFDSAIGGGGTSAEETTLTASGQARGVSGKHIQYTESGAISVGQKGSYVESGGLNLAGQKISVAKGAALTINQAPAPATSATALNGSPQQLASPGSAPSTQPPTLPPTPGLDSTTPAAAAPASTSSTFLQKLEGYWTNFSTAQKAGAGAVLVLVLWLIFHRRAGK
jgi:hypothetical protein